jgi:hypothetical protein
MPYVYNLYFTSGTGGLHGQLEAEHPLAAIIKVTLSFHATHIISYPRPKSWGGSPTWIYLVYFSPPNISRPKKKMA